MPSKELIDKIKTELSSYKTTREELYNQEERFEYLTYKLQSEESEESQDSEDIPAELIELQNKVKDLGTKDLETYRSTERLISRLDSPEERHLLRCKYLDLMDWQELNVIINMKHDDFEQREASYKRKMFRIHSSALTNLAKIYESEAAE